MLHQSAKQQQVMSAKTNRTGTKWHQYVYQG